MASATASKMIQGQSLKSHFVPIRVLSPIDKELQVFQKNALSSKIHPTDLIKTNILLI